MRGEDSDTEARSREAGERTVLIPCPDCNLKQGRVKLEKLSIFNI